MVPGTGGTIGYPGNDYGPPGGYIVNNTGGLLGPTFHLQNAIHSPVMAWPDPAMGGMSLAFDVYRHELLVADDTPGIFYTWSVRTCDYCDVAIRRWQSLTGKFAIHSESGLRFDELELRASDTLPAAE